MLGIILLTILIIEEIYRNYISKIDFIDKYILIYFAVDIIFILIMIFMRVGD